MNPSRVTSRDESTHLEEKFDPLDGGYGRFRDGSGDATSQEVLGEGDSLLTHLLGVVSRFPGSFLAQMKWPNPT